MKGQRLNYTAWAVRRQFEPNRLSPRIMAQAYEQIVPQQVRSVAVIDGEQKRDGQPFKPSQRRVP